MDSRQRAELDRYITGNYGEDYFADACTLCDGEGVIITCIDDICRGAGECMHGDGEEACPNGCGD